MKAHDAAWHLDRISHASILEDDVRQAARMAAYLIREGAMRPADFAAALRTIEEDGFR